jgi:hypothetical protein
MGRPETTTRKILDTDTTDGKRATEFPVAFPRPDFPSLPANQPVAGS